MRRRDREDDPRAFDFDPDHFEPYRPWDPGYDDDEDDDHDDGPHGIIAGPDEQIDRDLLQDDEDFTRCHHCGGEIWAGSDQCPDCGMWLIGDTSRHGRRTRFFGRILLIFLVMLLILAMALMI